MFFRRIIAVFLVFLFVAISAAAFVVFAISQTIIRPSFYEKDLVQPGYEFLVESTIKSIQENDGLISEHFGETDLRREVETVFPPTLFEKMVNQLVLGAESLKNDPEKPLTFKLDMYRESMLTLAHNLSFKIFESLPECTIEEIPEELDNGLPSCVPKDVEYNQISGVLSAQFEKDIYAAIPEQVEFGLNSTIGDDGIVLSQIFLMLDTVKISLFGILLFIIALIALVIYRPFPSVLLAEGIAFLISGIVGVVLGLFVTLIPSFVKYDGGGESDSVFETIHEPTMKFFSKIVELFSYEIQKGAIIFLAFGVILLLLRFYIKNR